MFKRIAVGEKHEEFISKNEGVRFNMEDSGATLTILFNKPNAQEIEDIKNGSLQFGLFVKEGVIFILSKFGNLNWMDSPFHTALTPGLTTLQDLDEGMGYGCNIILADCSNGEIKVLRYVGLSTLFSKKLKEVIEEQFVDYFDIVEYDYKLKRIINAYTSKDMVKMSLINCKIK